MKIIKIRTVFRSVILNTGLGLALTILLSASANAQLTCNRQCLTDYVDSYFAALTTNNGLNLPVSDDLKITNNGRLITLNESFWSEAEEVIYRWDIANVRLGDTGTEAVVLNSDGTKTMVALRLKVLNSQITEIEMISANEGDADRLWDIDNLTEVAPALQLTIREAEQDSYYGLIAAAESYWRAFQTNGTDAYHPAALLPDTQRFENGWQTTGIVRDGVYASTARGFDEGRFIGRNLWDRRYPVVDTERGIVLSFVRFGLKSGMESQSVSTSNDRIVAEFFAVKGGNIQEIHAVLFNLPDAEPSGWAPAYGPGQGGW